jgi:anti-anti-sigma factor
MSHYALEREETEDPRVVHVRLAGELDLTNARELEEELQALTPAEGSVLVLDLNRVVFLDSAALHVLFRAAGRLGRQRVVLVCAPEVPIAGTLRIVGLEAAADLVGSLEAALRTLGR